MVHHFGTINLMPYSDRETQLEYQRQHSKINRERYRKNLNARRAKMLAPYKDRPCTDCGQRYPLPVMQLHHPGQKTDSVSSLVRRGTVAQVHEEAKKCIPLCGNCHVLRHIAEGWTTTDEAIIAS